jgi:ferredoxin
MAITASGGVAHASALQIAELQWISHKLSTWYDQFGQSGCVGCGRCIAWCPVGIDITEEAARLAGMGDPDTMQAAGP